MLLLDGTECCGGGTSVANVFAFYTSFWCVKGRVRKSTICKSSEDCVGTGLSSW